MCIRDSRFTAADISVGYALLLAQTLGLDERFAPDVADYCCLLYTSDAADERSSVDLGGSGIIKKKTNNISLLTSCCYLIKHTRTV